LWRGPTYGAASFRDKETIRKRCWLRVRMTHGRSISGLRNVRFWPILLKNSFSTAREKISAVIGCDARFKLGGYVEDAMSRCKAS